MAEPQALSSQQPLNKQARAQLAQQIIKESVPKLLESTPRAARGVHDSRLLRGKKDLPPLLGEGNGSTADKKELKLSIVAGDTYDIAYSLRLRRPEAKLAVLNMASPKNQGGGVLRGAKAQEETLCLRSTLFPSLKPQWYHLPEDAVIWTEDVLVFGEFESNGNVRMLDKDEMWYLDIVSCAAVRKPPLKNVGHGEDEDYANSADEARMVAKCKHVMRACAKMGAQIVVLGAWGCGAYHNPIKKVARIMRECLVGADQGPEEDWMGAGIEEVVFAIFDETPEKKVWNVFVEEFRTVPGIDIGEAS